MPASTPQASKKRSQLAGRTTKHALGFGYVTLLHHLGESTATAIFLSPHRAEVASFKEGEPLGNDDMCWFKACMPPTFTGAQRPERFVVKNQSGGQIKIALHDISEKQTAALSGAQSHIELTHQTSGLDCVYFTIRRSDVKQMGLSVTWISPVSYLLLEEPMGLYVDDESGIDVPGADEPEMQISVDGDSFHLFSGDWDDADSGERWPNLDAAIRQRAHMRLPGAKRMGFVDSLSIGYVEPDMNAQGWLNAQVPTLTPAEPETAERRISMPVPDVVKDGHYIFYCTITKIP